MIERPDVSEYADIYARYVDRVPDGDVLRFLETRIEEAGRLFGGIGETKAGYRYAPGKWSIKEVVGHICDVERMFACRALAFARGEKTPLPGFEQDDYVKEANFDARTLPSLTAELRQIRAATVAMFRGFGDDVWKRVGTASGCRFSVRAILFIIAGHELHHTEVIRTKYL